MMTFSSSKAVILVLVGGCAMYFDADDRDVPPQEPTPDAGLCDGKVPQHVRAPDDGTCRWACSNGGSSRGWGLWPLCDTACNGLEEAACRSTDGCSASYIEEVNTAGQVIGATFIACGATAQSVSVHDEDCNHLGAYGCAQFDHCSMYYDTNGVGLEFVRCLPEGPTPACTTLTTEQTCMSRSDCQAIYEGTGCWCDVNQCWCEDKTFARCE